MKYDHSHLVVKKRGLGTTVELPKKKKCFRLFDEMLLGQHMCIMEDNAPSWREVGMYMPFQKKKNPSLQCFRTTSIFCGYIQPDLHPHDEN